MLRGDDGAHGGDNHRDDDDDDNYDDYDDGRYDDEPITMPQLVQSGRERLAAHA